VINRRAAGTWSSMMEDEHIPYRKSLWSKNWIEIHPDDASARDIKEGDEVRLLGNLQSDAHESTKERHVEGIARLSDRFQPGAVGIYFNYRGNPKWAANSLVSSREDPINGLFAFKLSRARLERA
jgi:anaerobic selenocysteine-containing dehydrogenase